MVQAKVLPAELPYLRAASLEQRIPINNSINIQTRCTFFKCLLLVVHFLMRSTHHFFQGHLAPEYVTLFGLAMKVIASTLTERGGWVSFAITPVFSIFKLLFESVHRVTQHWTQHTQCEVLHTHAHTSGNRYSVCGSLLPPKQQYETEEYPEIGNQSVSSSSTEESQLDWMSQFHFPFEVTIRTM